MKNKDVAFYSSTAIRYIEQFLAALILIAIVWFVLINLVNFDISSLRLNSTIVELISDILLLILGLEVARLLVSPSVRSTVELLIYVIARKALSPQATALDLLYNAVAFAIILMVSRIFLSKKEQNKADFFSSINSKQKEAN